jgi:hypothetical protein
MRASLAGPDAIVGLSDVNVWRNLEDVSVTSPGSRQLALPEHQNMREVKFCGVRVAALTLTMIGSFLLPAAAQEQTYVVEPKVSLAWWQMNPHLSHLWATTCPRDPDWRPGEGVGLSEAQNLLKSAHKGKGYGNVLDTIIPLYPRKKVRPICEDAVQGQVAVSDLKTLRGAHGDIVVHLEDLIMGMKMYDSYQRSILQVGSFPNAEFHIDSIHVQQPGDTMQAMSYGTFKLHGVEQPATIPLRIWAEPAGMRVTGKFPIVAYDLIEKYGLSKYKLGMGVAQLIWRYVYLGVDLIMKPAVNQAAQ